MTLLEGDPLSVGGYRLEGRLGAGGMGMVFLGRSVSGRRLAVKVIRPELATDEQFRARFRQEVAAARQVSGAFTAPVADADADAEPPWLATLFVPGPSLHQRVAESGPLPTQEVRLLAAGLVEALRDIHRVGLVHRDLKPGNVLLAEDGPRVIDFGIARAFAADPLTRTGVLVGTPAFMAPEQFRTGGIGPSGDVFALGSVLVYAATGHSPFEGQSTYGIGYRVVHEEPDLTGLAEELRPLVEPCLAKEPAARPTVEELLAALSAVAPPQEMDEPRLPGLNSPVQEEHPPSAKETPPGPAGPRAVGEGPSGVSGTPPSPNGSPPPGAENRPVTVGDPWPGQGAPPAPDSDPADGAKQAPPERSPVSSDVSTRKLRPAVSAGEFGPSAGEFGPSAGESDRPSPSARRPRRIALVAAAVVVAVSVAVAVPLLTDRFGRADQGAGGGPSTSSSASASAAGFSCAGAQGSLTGSGSTAIDAAMTKWTAGFQAACPGTTVAYNPTGSGNGVTTFLGKSAAFAGADIPLDATEVQQSRGRCGGGGQAIHLPLVATPVAVAYNLPGVSHLVLDAPTLAKIFDSRIPRWDDEAIKKLNPGVKLPSLNIQTFHRSDASTATHAFSSYLGGAAPNDWRYHQADSAWPAPNGLSVSGDAGMNEAVTQTSGSVGYLGLAGSGRLATVRLLTGASAPVEADAIGTTKALAAAKAGGSGDDLSLTLDPATRAEGAYPIPLVSYGVVCDKGNDPATLKTLRAFLSYATSAAGRSAATAQGYALLPDALVERVRDTVRALG
ncbi:phosphate ABC transporter substrate-binding protein PstS [Streptomyces sp. NPDC002514]|uniref:phosphate ABC transporter substrate-binding protein PstS n=1 Tax=Streptomyces sp. NPDC001270 TaxID=3364554 RepID=UPI003688166A